MSCIRVIFQKPLLSSVTGLTFEGECAPRQNPGDLLLKFPEGAGDELLPRGASTTNCRDYIKEHIPLQSLGTSSILRFYKVPHLLMDGLG